MHLRVKHANGCCCDSAPLFSVLPYWLLGEHRLCACGRKMPQREIASHTHAILQLVRCNSLLLNGSNLPLSGYAMIVVTCSRDAVELKGRAGAAAENVLCVVERHLQLDDPDMPGAHTGKACEEGTWHAGGVLKQLSFLDRFLPVWIIGAMGLGLLLGYFVPAVERAFDGIQIDSVSLPIAIGYSLLSSLALSSAATTPHPMCFSETGWPLSSTRLRFLARTCRLMRAKTHARGQEAPH